MGTADHYMPLGYLFKIDSIKAELLRSQLRQVVSIQEPYWAGFYDCLCLAVTSKRIELKSRGWSQIVALEKIFPNLM